MLNCFAEQGFNRKFNMTVKRMGKYRKISQKESILKTFCMLGNFSNSLICLLLLLFINQNLHFRKIISRIRSESA